MTGSLSSVHASHEDADRKSADYVDGSDDETCNSVSFDELASTVHSTVEVSLSLNVLTTLLCALFIDESRVKVSVD